MSEWKHPQHVWCEIACSGCGEVRGMFYERGAIGLIRQAVKKEWWRDCGLDGVFYPDCLEK